MKKEHCLPVIELYIRDIAMEFRSLSLLDELFQCYLSILAGNYQLRFRRPFPDLRIDSRKNPFRHQFIMVNSEMPGKEDRIFFLSFVERIFIRIDSVR